MAVIPSTGGSRNIWGSFRRVVDSAWFGTTNNYEKAPDLLNGEFIQAVNVAGTGVTQVIGQASAKTIIDSSATALADVAIASGARCGGLLFYTVEVGDGTDHQALTGIVSYSSVNKAGTQTLAITNATANDAKAASSGTLTLSWTLVTGTGKCTIKVQPTGSLTETTYTVTFTIIPIVGTVTLL